MADVTDLEQKLKNDAANEMFAQHVLVLVRCLVDAARDGRSHMSHDNQKDCLGCAAVKAGIEFMKQMKAKHDIQERELLI